MLKIWCNKFNPVYSGNKKYMIIGNLDYFGLKKCSLHWKCVTKKNSVL